MRLEQFERLRRIAEALHSAATVSGTTSDFQPAKPWDSVFAMAVQNREFWAEHVHDPALLFLAHVKSRGSLEEDMGTAPIISVESEQQWTPRNNKRTHAAVWEEPSLSTPDRLSDDRSSQKDGRFTNNRRGGQICYAFNDGTCSKVGKCPKGYNHQCSICLSNTHGAHECDSTRSVRQPGAKGQKGKGKGRNSKGRGKGR